MKENAIPFIVSPHTHVESKLTASTLANMIQTAKKLNRKYFSYTDHGHLSSALKTYTLAKTNDLIPILGVEIYFKDSNCSIITGTNVEKCAYFTGTIYCKDQEAYQALCKLISNINRSTTVIYGETQTLWSWEDLEYISKYNVDFVSGGIHCMIGKCLLANRADIGLKIFNKLTNIFKDNFYVCIIAESYSKKWNNVVEIFYKDGTKDAILAEDMIKTDRAMRIKAIDLIGKTHHSTIVSKYSNFIRHDVNKIINKTVLHKGFLPLPGGDALLKVNKFLISLSEKYGIKSLVSDYAYYSNKEDKIVQTMILESHNTLHPNFYMKNGDEIVSYLSNKLNLNQTDINKILTNNNEWSKQYDDFNLKYQWKLADTGLSALSQAMEIIKKNGRMEWNNPVWIERLKTEIQVIAKNGIKDLTPYFLPICDIMNFYKDNGSLTGPGRGSCGGSLFCYVLGITHVNPFKYDLPFSRFFSMDRVLSGKLPDIDSDLGDRTLLVGEDGKSGYLFGKYGNKCAQISTRNTIRLKTAIKDVNRYMFGSVDPEIENLTKGLPNPQQGISDRDAIFGFENEEDGTKISGLIHSSKEIKEYIIKRPEEWKIVEKSLGITRSFGVHAAAFILADEPICNIVPLKEGTIAQYEMKEVETAGLIKYDFLKVDQLKDIELCLNLINKRNNQTNNTGYFTHNNNELFIWNLPEIPEVFKSIWNGSTETIFQINTKSMTPFVQNIMPKNIEDLAIIQALVRPGPLDFIDETTGRSMAEEYCLRRKGESKADIPILEKLIPETFGIFCFQESLTNVAKELAGFSGDEAEKLRENMGKKKMSELIKMKPKFIEGAKKTVDEKTAENIWERMVTFGRYGFNKAHGTAYSIITYACMFLKYYYPLEWWAAILSNAEESEITTTFWPYVKDMVSSPDINLSTDMVTVDYKNKKLRAKFGMIKGMGDAGIKRLLQNRPYKNLYDFVDKNVAGEVMAYKLIHAGILNSLFSENLDLMGKFKSYADTVEIKKFNDKYKKAQKNGTKIRSLHPKTGEIPIEYLNLHKEPFRDVAMKKSVLPSLPIDLFSLGMAYSKTVRENAGSPPVAINSKGYKSLFINGHELKHLDNMGPDDLTKNVYVASTVFVLKTQEFTFAKNTKRALKIFIDADGYISEKVLWPDYKSGILKYPDKLKTGSIATIFFQKRTGRKELSIVDIIVES